jgi:hypothetical protein
MRHFIDSCPVTSGALRMGETSTARVLVTLGRFAQARAASRLGTAVGAIDLAAIAAATNEHLCPTAGAKEQAARGLLLAIAFGHRRSDQNAEDERIDRSAPAVEYCGCTRSLC